MRMRLPKEDGLNTYIKAENVGHRSGGVTFIIMGCTNIRLIKKEIFLDAPEEDGFCQEMFGSVVRILLATVLIVTINIFC